jgi:hypothetical protein
VPRGLLQHVVQERLLPLEVIPLPQELPFIVRAKDVHALYQEKSTQQGVKFNA